MRLAADANVLLSAVIGGQANRVLHHPAVKAILTTADNMREVHEYIPSSRPKRKLALDLLLLKVATLPVTVVSRSVYRGSLAEARRRIGRRCPDDAELLALALHFKIPVWSNDNDFADAGVAWHTTAEVLSIPH